MKAPLERMVRVNGHYVRVLEKGKGEPIGYLAGVLGLPRWSLFLDRLAEHRRVLAPSLPGFPGATGHEDLDDITDWICATLDLLDAVKLDGCDLIGASLGGALAAEVATVSRSSVRRLVLLAPLGLNVQELPFANFWALAPKRLQEVVGANRDEVARQLACPDGVDELEWSIVTRRAITAGARLFWPLGDVGLAKRLRRIRSKVCVVWGDNDEVIPSGYAEQFAERIPSAVEVIRVPHAGHLVDWDAPDQVAQHVLQFLDNVSA
jgi:pimeloyl-ACP methyl ester carboxylesterase